MGPKAASFRPASFRPASLAGKVLSGSSSYLASPAIWLLQLSGSSSYLAPPAIWLLQLSGSSSNLAPPAIWLLQLSGSSSYLAPNSVSIQSSGRPSFKKFYWPTNRRAAVNLQLNGLTQKEVRLVHDNQSCSHHASKYTKHGEPWVISYTKTI